MKVDAWIQKNTSSLRGRTVAVTGSTGGLGQELCRHLARLEAELVLLDRNPRKADSLDAMLREEFPEVRIRRIFVDMEELPSVRAAAEALRELPVDVLILNAGAYSIPRHPCETGLDNVFQINFASPYYLVRELMSLLRRRGGRVVAVGSIAHNYSVTDPDDVDFSKRAAASKVYGNAKRYLTAALFELFREESQATVSVVHPGITFTNITSHYPKVIFALIKHPMKVIFMKPKKASLCILRGVFEACEPSEWIGPWLFDVWGIPKRKPLKTIPLEECRRIYATAEEIYRGMK